MLLARQLTVTRYPAKCNRLPTLVELGHFTQELSKDVMVMRVTAETLQSISGGGGGLKRQYYVRVVA
jgi:hypothetical protein